MFCFGYSLCCDVVAGWLLGGGVFVICVGLVVLCFLNIAVVWYVCGLGCVGIIVLLCGGW